MDVFNKKEAFIASQMNENYIIQETVLKIGDKKPRGQRGISKDSLYKDEKTITAAKREKHGGAGRYMVISTEGDTVTSQGANPPSAVPAPSSPTVPASIAANTAGSTPASSSRVGIRRLPISSS